MIFKSPAMRLSIALILLTFNLLLIANLIGFIPDKSDATLELRKSLSESLALQFSAVAEKKEYQIIQNTLREVVERNKDIRSAAIRTNDGRLIALAGEHLANWKSPGDGKSTPTQVQVPVYRKGEKWATVEICFAPIWTDYIASGFKKSFVGLLAFISFFGFLCYFFIIKKTLRELDPTAVIPERVQRAFDVLTEGVLILDNKEQIVMANKAFAGLFEKTPDKMIGLKGSELGWLHCQGPKQLKQLPWFSILLEGMEQKSASLSLLDNFGKKVKLAVNAAVVKDNAGQCRGSLVTFDDITQLEEKNFELNELVEVLQLKHNEIHAKSQELEFLASHDPMTLCLNRRSLDKKLSAIFSRLKASGGKLSCLMVDIDHFKSINDRFGHAIGDQVIKSVADVLKHILTRRSDLVGRYGGEEFCVVLIDQDQQQAAEIAEKIRATIQKNSCAGVKVTISIGVSSLEHNVNKPDELVNQADKALYAAKRSGRNRVVQWGAEDLSGVDQTAEIATTSEGSSSASPEEEKISLHHRIQELEELLEKRALELEHYEMYDIKTGLPNRTLFEDRVGREIARGKRRDFLVAVLAINFDTIKRVNETLGRSTAELLVKACGLRLNDALRENIDTVAVMEESMASVSLVSQTEFAVLLTEMKQVDSITSIIKRLLDYMDQPLHVDGHDIFATAYIGVSIFPYDGQTVEDLYSSAANASRFAKEFKGKERYLFSSKDLNNLAIKQLNVENALHTAIQNEELELFYQPQIESSSGRVAGLEVLLRWNSSELGEISPADFIPVAEQYGQIDQLGDWVLYHACQQLRNWLDMGLDIPLVVVNVSGVQLRQQNLVARIRNILDEFKLEPHMLEIELTESCLVDSYDKNFSVLKQIKKMGIRVTMDDFGTGYSSLASLKNIPLSCIKIDRSFIADIGKDETSDRLITSIVSMAHGLGFEVVAEGVENETQAIHMTNLNCEYLQGYHFSRPLPATEVAYFFQKEQVV